MIIAVDFDGTIVEHAYPAIGRDLGALYWLMTIKNAGCELVLWTCRTGQELNDAINWLHANGYDEVITKVNERADTTPFGDDPRKLFANLYLDDRALGAPMKFDPKTRESVGYDWDKAGPPLVAIVEKQIKREEEARDAQR